MRVALVWAAESFQARYSQRQAHRSSGYDLAVLRQAVVISSLRPPHAHCCVGVRKSFPAAWKACTGPLTQACASFETSSCLVVVVPNPFAASCRHSPRLGQNSQAPDNQRDGAQGPYGAYSCRAESSRAAWCLRKWPYCCWPPACGPLPVAARPHPVQCSSPEQRLRATTGACSDVLLYTS